MPRVTRTIFRWLAAALFVAAGLNHFRTTDFYVTMMPPYLPWPRGLVWISGAAEILGGVGILPVVTRRFSGWWLIALLLAVFPANVHMALHGFQNAPAIVLRLRLPFQGVFMAWVYWTSLARGAGQPSGR